MRHGIEKDFLPLPITSARIVFLGITKATNFQFLTAPSDEFMITILSNFLTLKFDKIVI